MPKQFRYSVQIKNREKQVQKIEKEIKRKFNGKGVKLTPPKQIQQVAPSNFGSLEMCNDRCSIVTKTDIPFEDLPF